MDHDYCFKGNVKDEDELLTAILKHLPLKQRIALTRVNKTFAKSVAKTLAHQTVLVCTDYKDMSTVYFSEDIPCLVCSHWPKNSDILYQPALTDDEHFAGNYSECGDVREQVLARVLQCMPNLEAVYCNCVEMHRFIGLFTFPTPSTNKVSHVQIDASFNFIVDFFLQGYPPVYAPPSLAVSARWKQSLLHHLFVKPLSCIIVEFTCSSIYNLVCSCLSSYWYGSMAHPKLQTLRLEWDLRESDVERIISIKPLVEALLGRNNWALEQLVVENLDCNDSMWSFIRNVQSFPLMQNLKTLHFWCIVDLERQDVMRIFSAFPQLKILGLAPEFLSPPRELFDSSSLIASHLTSLMWKQLDTEPFDWKLPLDDDEPQTICPNFKRLSLINCCFQSHKETASKIPNLQEIVIFNHEIYRNVQGIHYHNQNLKFLNLTGCIIHKHEYVRIIGYCTRLEFVSFVSCCGFDNDTFIMLKDIVVESRQNSTGSLTIFFSWDMLKTVSPFGGDSGGGVISRYDVGSVFNINNSLKLGVLKTNETLPYEQEEQLFDSNSDASTSIQNDDDDADYLNQ
jgi:hypothetical protein